MDNLERLRESMDMDNLADNLEYIMMHEDDFYEGDFSPEDLYFESDSIASFVSLCVRFGTVMTREAMLDEFEGESKESISSLRDSGNDDLADALEYIRENKEDFLMGDVNDPDEIPHYDYAMSLYLLESVNFGAALIIDAVNNVAIENEEE